MHITRKRDFNVKGADFEVFRSRSSCTLSKHHNDWARHRRLCAAEIGSGPNAAVRIRASVAGLGANGFASSKSPPARFRSTAAVEHAAHEGYSQTLE